MVTGYDWCHSCAMEFAYMAENEKSLIKCPFCGEVMMQCNMCKRSVTCVDCLNSYEDLNTMRDKLRHTGGFADDEEKMFDFITLSQEEFLKSYSYLTEEEYCITATQVLSIVRNYFETV